MNGATVVNHLLSLALIDISNADTLGLPPSLPDDESTRFNSSFCDESSVDFPPEGKVPMKNFNETDNLLMLEDSERRSSSTVLVFLALLELVP